jgi:hypothetical protein
LRFEIVDRPLREKFRAQRPETALLLPKPAAAMRKPGTSDENTARLTPVYVYTGIIAEKLHKLSALIKVTGVSATAIFVLPGYQR